MFTLIEYLYWPNPNFDIRWLPWQLSSDDVINMGSYPVASHCRRVGGNEYQRYQNSSKAKLKSTQLISKLWSHLCNSDYTIFMTSSMTSSESEAQLCIRKTNSSSKATWNNQIQFQNFGDSQSLQSHYTFHDVINDVIQSVPTEWGSRQLSIKKNCHKNSSKWP